MRSRSSSWPSSSELVAVERERLGATFGERRVVLVHELGDVVEEERGGERRGARRLDLDEVDRGAAAGARGVREARAGRRRPGGTRGRSRARRERPDSGGRPASRRLRLRRCCQSGVRWPGRRRGIRSARAAFSRKRAPKSAVPPSSPTTRSSSSSGPNEQLGERRRRVGVRQAEHDAVVRPDEVDLEPERLRMRAASGQRPGRVDAGAEGREDAERASPRSRRGSARRRSCGRRDRARRLAPARRGSVSRFAAARSSRPCSSRERSRARRVARRAPSSRVSAPIASPELERAARALAMPERHLAGLARRRRDEHAVARDLLDAPRRGAEEEDLARTGSKTISSSSSPTRGRAVAARTTPKRPRSGIVPAFVTASRRAPSRRAELPATRSQVMRGRSSAKSSHG